MVVQRMVRCVALLACLVAVSLLGTGVAIAQNRIYQCNNCTPAQTSTLAQKLGMGIHLVGDFTNNTLWAYQVTREPNGNHGYIYEVDPADATAMQQEAFADYYKLITVNHASVIIVDIPAPPNRPQGYPLIGDTATDIMWASQTNFSNGLLNFFSEIQKGGYDGAWMGPFALAAMQAMQIGITVDSYTASINFRFQTNDGSIITYNWTNGTGSLVSVMDKYGNTIPIRNYNGATNFNGYYTLPAGMDPVYYNNLINYLNTFGAGLASQVPPGKTQAIICAAAKCFIEYPN